ncbi:MAG: hypothetical protein V3U20_06085, partial [Thermoplasmata archaeon]
LNFHNHETVDVLFYKQSWDRFEDFSDTVISNEKGVLLVNQKGVGESYISGNANRLLKLDMSAVNSDIIIEKIVLIRIGKGNDDDVSVVRIMEGTSTIATGTMSMGFVELQTSISLRDGDSKTFYVEVDINTVAQEKNSIGFRIAEPHDINTNKGTIALRSTSPEQNHYDISYITSVPQEISVDGAFADWTGKDLMNDNAGDVDNKNLDIIDYGISNTSEMVSFYLRVDGKIGWGRAVPYWNDAKAPQPAEPGEPGEPGPARPTPTPQPRTGEDLAYIYIDSDNVSATGYSIGEIGAEHLIEIKGRYGEIISKKHLSFFGLSPQEWKWFEDGSIDAETDTSRLETQIRKSDLNVTGHFQVYFQTTDWSGSIMDYSDESSSRGLVGEYPLSSMVKIVGKEGTRGTGTVVGEVNQAPPTIGWGDSTETEMLNFSIEGSGDNITIDKINITHGGSGQYGDCTVYIYNESESTNKGVLDGDEILLNTGGTTLTGDVNEIDINNMDIGADYKAYILITVVFGTDINDVGDDHYINITAKKDFWLTDASDNIDGTTFPLAGGPTEIIPEFKLIAVPIIGTLAIFFISRKASNRKERNKQ